MEEMTPDDKRQMNKGFKDAQTEATKREETHTDQIAEIFKRFDKQDEETEEYRKEREKLENERANAYGELAVFVRKSFKDRDSKLDGIEKKIDDFIKAMTPLLNIFKSVQGADRVGVWILKFIVGLSSLIIAIGVIILAIKRIITGSFF